MSIITGATNTDGSGSAANLTAENGHEIDLTYYTDHEHNDGGSWWNYVDGDTTVYLAVSHYAYQTGIITNTAEWNAEGQKEISVDLADLEWGGGAGNIITISNFVDVNLHAVDLHNGGILVYTIEGAKRGTLDFSESGGLLDLTIEAKSNGASWSNLFEVTGSTHNDDVTITGDSDSQYTEFSIDLGTGDDEFASTLADAIYASQTRFVDGGEGTDTIRVYNNESTDTIADVDFINFEVLKNYNEDPITLTEYVLANNGSEDEPLIVDIEGELDFAGDVDSITASESDYDEGFYEVTVDYGDTSYTIITNSIDEAWLA